MISLFRTLFRTRPRTLLAGLLLAGSLMHGALAIAQTIDTTTEPVAGFIDVETNHRYLRSIETLAKEGIVQGFPIGTFLPEREINRAEALKIIVGSFPGPIKSAGSESENSPEEPEEVTPPSFTDVDIEAWYFPYLEQALQRGLVRGYDDQSFRPGATLNRAEALKIIVEAVDIEKQLASEPLETAPALDVPADAWFAPYVQYGLNQGMIYLDENENLNPAGTVTRGELTDMIYRIKHPDVYSGQVYYGNATYYADKFDGKGTASGERFDQTLMTAAHRTLPFGTRLRVTHRRTLETVEVTVNDRGPYSDHAIVDLSKAAFDAIGHLGSGVIPVEIEVIHMDAEPS